MNIIGTPLERIDWPFLKRLVSDEIPESITHDYKGRFPDPRDEKSKSRFLKSAAAFANTSGGVFVFGVDASTDPWTMGLPELDEDLDVLSLQNLLRSGIDPPLHSVTPVKLRGPSGEQILLLAIPRSLAAPHELSGNYGGGYWRRNSRGNYPMAVKELRRAFEESDRWREDAEQFGRDRISYITSGLFESGLGRAYGGDMPALFFHLLPLGRLRELVDTEALLAFADNEVFGWAGEGSAVWRPNIDGWVWFRSVEGERRHIQLFRNGGFEYYADLALYKARSDLSYLEGNWLDLGLVTITEKAFRWTEAAGVPGPFVLSLSMRRAAQLKLRFGSKGFMSTGFDRAALDLPQIVVDQTSDDIPQALRPLLDSLWLSAGAKRDPHFDEAGNWTLSAETFQFQPV